MVESQPECRERWKNRRWMAWAAFGNLTAQTMTAVLVGVLKPEAVNALSALLMWTSGAWLAIIGGYITLATIEDIKFGKGIKDAGQSADR